MGSWGRKLFGILCLLLLAAASPVNGTTPNLPVATNVEVAIESGRTRFTVEATQAIGFNVYVLPDPYRAIIDLPAIDFRLPVGSGGSAQGLLTGYRFGKMDQDRSRIVIDLDGPALIEKSFVVQAKDGRPARLVVELASTDASIAAEEAPPVISLDPKEAPSEEPKAHPRRIVSAPLPQPKPGRAQIPAKAMAQPPSPKPDGQRVVVIDPGHGGIDPGAIGFKGTAEKDVVLAFARDLRKALERGGRYKIVMTRDDDVFRSLRDRVGVARDNNADLLIALHADSLKRSGTRGATVYTLSDKASDAEAEALAQKENRADIIGGVDLAAESEEVTGILIDLAQRETKNHSMVFARRLAKELQPVTRLTGRPIRSAGFRVLKAPDVPSVLLELGYLSSKSDEELLTSQAWRERISKSVAEAIDQYFATQLASGH